MGPAGVQWRERTPTLLILAPSQHHFVPRARDVICGSAYTTYTAVSSSARARTTTQISDEKDEKECGRERTSSSPLPASAILCTRTPTTLRIPPPHRVYARKLARAGDICKSISLSAGRASKEDAKVERGEWGERAQAGQADKSKEQEREGATLHLPRSHSILPRRHRGERCAGLAPEEPRLRTGAATEN
jgi:hypothetical protein